MKTFPVIKKLDFILTVVSTIVVGFIVSDITTIVLAQPSNIINQDNLMTTSSKTVKSDTDGEQIVVTWLKLNDTRSYNTPVISISNQDFWNAFDPLLEQLILPNNYK